MNFTEYADLDGTALAELIAKEDVSVDEVTDAARNAIEERNPGLNAVIGTVQDQPYDNGPFAGVPFLTKELILQAEGAMCRSGCRAVPAVPMSFDTSLMTRFRQAGLHLLGTTQSPEMGYNATTETVAFGPVHNPWKAGHSAGGSSGGSGAAVAAGLVPIAHASDGGGSIRVPASCNGLVGLKPTRDRTPTGPTFADPLFAHGIEFVVSRSVRDSARLLDIVAGPDLGAPHIVAPPERSFADAALTSPGQLKVGWIDGSMLGTPVRAECVAAVSNTRAMLEELGHELIETSLDLDFDQFAENINLIWCAFAAHFVDEVTALTGHPADNNYFEAVTLTCARFGSAASATEVLDALDYVNRITRETAQAFQGYDVLMSSTLGAPPPRHGTLNQDDPDISAIDWTRQTFEYATNTPLFNSTGQPAISLPLHWTADNLPVGVQFAGRMGDEGVLLSLASQLENAVSWGAKQREVWT